MDYIKAPPGWAYTDANPFTRDGSYGLASSCFCLLDGDDDQFHTGRSGRGPFSARFGRRVTDLESRLVDFIRYENAHNRTVILSFPKDVDVDGLLARARLQTPPADLVRLGDPEIVVHSTTRAAWESIVADGELRAASYLDLDRERSPSAEELSEIERYYQDEPTEYADYVMVGLMDSTAPELVLASNRAGSFVWSEDAVYEPGARLYLDNHRIIADGLCTRDGLHVAKVHERLPLAPYLLAAITVDDLDPEDVSAEWTPKTFVARANASFWASAAGTRGERV
jgi:hypothetical protein